MELQRGVCSLCSENTRVLTPSDAEEFSKLLPALLYENFLTNSEFQKIKSLIKICVICCFKVQTAFERKKVIEPHKNEVTFRDDICHFCKADKCLMKVGSNWKYITDRTEGYVNFMDFPVSACPKCLFFFDVIYNFKTKLTYKFPQLAIQKKKSSETPRKENDTPKKKSLSKSPPSSTKRKIFDNCFTYLQPLCNNKYRVDDKLKKDIRLYKKIAYVNLKNSKDIDVKETPKMRPVIKIKLKPKHKKVEKEAAIEKAFAKLSRSEEMPSRSGKSKSRKRRHSQIEKVEPSVEPEEKLQETPKAASIESLVPKRRVSEYIDNAEKENEESKEEEKEESNEQSIKEDEGDLPKETAEEEKPSSPKVEAEPEEIADADDVNKNGVEEPSFEITEQMSPLVVTSENVLNGEKSEENTEIVKEDEENQKTPSEEHVEDANLSDSSKSTPRKSPSKSESSSDGSDSDASDDRDKNKDVSESDVLNGSERKKKRVTFSDEVND